MNKYATRGSLAALLLTTGAAVAQPPATQPPPAAQPPAATPGTATVMQPYRAKQVLGSKVSIQGNTSIGTVDDIVFDDSGAIEYLIVNDNQKLVTVPWQAAKFDFKQQTAVINITRDQYQKIPTYTLQTYPSFYTPAYRTETYRYYGLTPGQLRRIERDIRR